jgi:acetolactate synthase-1/2/3 large subunit
LKRKVSDYIAEFFVENGIKTIFTVVGGGAMHMNNSFGHHPGLKCIYNHHEQASAMAAEAYYRVNNEMAGVCVTSGPGAINALNGVGGAYMDSIPMIVISGQCRSDLMARAKHLKVRTLGPQEFDIVPTLGNYTKFAETLFKPEDVRWMLEKAMYLAKEGRPGPVWIEVPVDVQGAYVETVGLEGFEEPLKDRNIDIKVIDQVCDMLAKANRPVIYAGNGIRIAGAADLLSNLAHKFKTPVVTCWDSIDLMETDDEFYVGRAGIMGDRAGNFAVQNSDLVLAIGARLSIYQVGYNLKSWAREAIIIDVDIDPDELEKPTIRVDLPVCCDAKEFIKELLSRDPVSKRGDGWKATCGNWKKIYPVVSGDKYEIKEPVNVYAFIDKFSRSLPENTVTVVANGSASVVGSAAYYIRHGSRFLMNCAMSSMGYDLPAAIGACVASGKKAVVCIAGDGSIMMNLQELQTIVCNRLPIKIVVINNEGYHQIRQTQTNLFEANYVGIGPQSKDLSFPEFQKIAEAFEIPYFSCHSIDELEAAENFLMQAEGFCMMEVFCDCRQNFEPKSATKRLEDGTLVSPPLEDLAPFLPREELERNMIIDLYEET